MDMQAMEAQAEQVAGFLKGLANPHRLFILCRLGAEEKSVTQLIEETGIAQTSMSQHLAKLREEEIVTFRRDHRTLYYKISNPAVSQIMEVLYDNFCGAMDDDQDSQATLSQ